MSPTDIPDDLRTPASFRSALGRIAAALAVFAAVNVAMGLVLDAARDRCGDGDTGVINNAIRATPDILILGSSRAQHHYDDRLLSKLWNVRVFNAGRDGHGLPYSRVVLEQVAKRHKPRAVIIDLTHFPEDMERVHSLDLWHAESRVLESLPATDNPSVGKRLGRNLLMKIPAYRYAGKIKDTWNRAGHPPSDTGFESLESHAPMNPKQGDKPPSPWFIPQLALIVAEARAIGAEVILCISPTKAESPKKTVIAPAREWAGNNGVIFVDFNEDRFPVFADEGLFRDRGHLNARGAEVFTRFASSHLATLLPETLGPPMAPASSP